MTVNINDIQRLTKEMGHQFSDDSEFDMVEWAKKQDIEEEALSILIGAAVNAVKETMREQIVQVLESGDDLEVDENGRRFGFMDIGDLIANSCTHCFMIGWEASKQYGHKT